MRGTTPVSYTHLGTINSVVLTAEYMKNRGIAAKGIIFNRYEAVSYTHLDVYKRQGIYRGGERLPYTGYNGTAAC